jgi:hypothetical protein
MLTSSERAQLKRELKNFRGLSYGQIALVLTEKFEREISRSTVRYYLESMPDYEGRTKGRPSGLTRNGDIWDQLLPELLALTGVSASRLYRALTYLLEPALLPFGESAFHERTGLRQPVGRTAKKKAGTLLERCNLRIKVVAVSPNDAEGKRVYLFGYEEFTGYTAFDVISPTPLNARRIASFVKAIEDHLGLPVRRVCLVGNEFTKLAGTKLCEQVDVRYLDGPNASSQLISAYKRSAEIDLLQRIVKKQNDEVARVRAAVAKDAISRFVQLSRLREEVWESPAQRRVTQRLQAKAEAEATKLKPFLKLRFKLYIPSRRPTRPYRVGASRAPPGVN